MTYKRGWESNKVSTNKEVRNKVEEKISAHIWTALLIVVMAAVAWCGITQV